MTNFLLPALLTLSLANPPAAQTTHLLFSVERSTNVNKLYYEARITGDTAIDSLEPVHAYWIMWAKDPSGRTREELTFLEKRAYGFTLTRDSAGAFIMTLAACPKRPIEVRKQRHRAVAETRIGGRSCFIDKLYIAMQPGFFPKVDYVELSGYDVRTGEPRHERLLPGGG